MKHLNASKYHPNQHEMRTQIADLKAKLAAAEQRIDNLRDERNEALANGDRLEHFLEKAKQRAEPAEREREIVNASNWATSTEYMDLVGKLNEARTALE